MNAQAIADYVLGEASPEERAAFERALAQDPALRERVHRLEAVAGSLTGMSTAAWQVALGEGEPSPVTAPRERRSWNLTLRGVGIAGLAALVLFVAGIGAGVLISGSGGVSARRGTQLALRPLAGGPTDVSGDAYLSGANGMVLVIHRLPETTADRYYEAWLMTNIRQLVPIAAFRVNADGGARLVLQLPADATSYKYIDISLQSVGTGEAHSAISVLRGPTT
jgi:hypothetical protein